MTYIIIAIYVHNIISNLFLKKPSEPNLKPNPKQNQNPNQTQTLLIYSIFCITQGES